MVSIYIYIYLVYIKLFYFTIFFFTIARISFEDDSFKKFTGEIVKKYMQEEEMRSKHQVNLNIS